MYEERNKGQECFGRVGSKEKNDHQLISDATELHKPIEVCISYIAHAGETVIHHETLDSVSYGMQKISKAFTI